MDNYFTSSRLLTHLGVNSIQATVVLKKQLQKKDRGDFEQRTSSKKAVKL